MAAGWANWNPGPAARTSLFYSTLLMSVAIANPFLPLWLADKGMSPGEIGLINSTPILLMVVLNLVVGRFADRANDWRTVIVIGCVLSAIPPFLLIVAEGFWPILIVWTLLNLPFQSVAPVVDAAAVRLAIRIGGDFGRIRAWGTVGFIVATLIGGLVMNNVGIVAFVPLFIAVSLLRAVLAFQLPLFRDPSRDAAGPAAATATPEHYAVATRSRDLWRPWFVLALIGGSLLFMSQMMLMGFGALMWSRAGVDSFTIGLLWSIGPAAEIVAMLTYKRLTHWFSARQLLLVACLCGVLRWLGFALEPDVPVIAALQLFHFATTGFLIMGMTNFIANWTSENMAAEAQSFFIMLRQVGSVLGLAGFGFLVGWMGSQAYYVAAAIALVAAATIFASLRMMSVRSEVTLPGSR
jgi:PPP family 3-phenylpropionic acid transporter